MFNVQEYFVVLCNGDITTCEPPPSITQLRSWYNVVNSYDEWVGWKFENAESAYVVTALYCESFLYQRLQ